MAVDKLNFNSYSFLIMGTMLLFVFLPAFFFGGWWIALSFLLVVVLFALDIFRN